METTMQLEDLQRQWQTLDAKLDQVVKMNGELLRLAVIQPVRRKTNRLAFWPALNLAFCALILLFAGSFLADHWRTWSLVLPAVVAMVAVILLLNSSIRQLMLVSKIDWNGAVVDAQCCLSRLREAKIREFKWIILLSPLAGFCGLIVSLQWLLDGLPQPKLILDIVNSWWVVGNYVFGVSFIFLGQIAVGFLAQRFQGQGWWQRALDDISGRSLKKVREELENWANLDSKVEHDV